MKVVAMIPIKLNSERIPGKSIKRFDDGKLLITFILEAMKKVHKIDEIYVYCSNDEICDYLIEGVTYVKRSSNLDTAETSMNEILLAFQEEVEADIYVLSHATSPFIKEESISNCVEAVLSGHYDSAFAVTSRKEFLWDNEKPLNYDPQNIPRTQDLSSIYCETSGVYVFEKEIIKNYGRRIGFKPYLCEVGRIESMDIDYPEDFEIANAVYMQLMKASTK